MLEVVKSIKTRHDFAGKETQQKRATAISRGGRDVEGFAASEHCQVLRLLGSDPDQAEIHRTRY